MATKLDQKPAEVHVEIHKGDSLELLITVADTDLTGYTITAAIHPKDGSADVPLTIEATDLAAGQYTIKLPAATSANLAADYHTWCNIVQPPYVNPALPEPRTYLAGRFIVGDCS